MTTSPRHKTSILVALLLTIVALVLGACASSDPEQYDWCYKFDFLESNPFGVAYGSWVPFVGYVTDDAYRLVLSYSSATPVYPAQVLVRMSRIDAGDISVAASGAIFGIAGNVEGTFEQSFNNQEFRLSAPYADTNSTTANVSLIASGKVAITSLQVYGRLANPFGTSNCGIAVPTNTPTVITNTPFPTLTFTPLPATVTPTPTPTMTLTPTNTPTPTITPTFATCNLGQATYTIHYDGGEPYFTNSVWGPMEVLETDSYYDSIWGWNTQSYWVIKMPANAVGYHATISINPVLYNNGYRPNQIRFRYGSSDQTQGYPGAGNRLNSAQYDQQILYIDAIGIGNPSHVTCISNPSTCGRMTLGNIVLQAKHPTCQTMPGTPTATPTPTLTITPTSTITPLPTITNTRLPNPTFTPAYTPSVTRTPSRTPIPIYVPPTALPATSTPIHSATPNQTLTAQWEGTVTESALTATTTGTSTGGSGASAPIFGWGWGWLNDVSNNISEVSGIGGAVSAFLTNSSTTISGWGGQFSGTFNAVNGAWVNTAAAPMPGTPLCLTAPLSSELCAIYYILTYTLLSGSVGSLIVPVGTIVIDLYGVFLFIKLGRAIVARMTEIVKS